MLVHIKFSFHENDRNANHDKGQNSVPSWNAWFNKDADCALDFLRRCCSVCQPCNISVSIQANYNIVLYKFLRSLDANHSPQPPLDDDFKTLLHWNIIRDFFLYIVVAFSCLTTSFLDWAAIWWRLNTSSHTEWTTQVLCLKKKGINVHLDKFIVNK